jgi:hypothetical protein
LVSASEDTTLLVWDLTGGDREPPGELSQKDLQAAWDDLGDADAIKAYRAIWKMAAAPEQTVPFLQQQLQPASAGDVQQIARWVAQLDSDRFADREQAIRELERVGELAEPALRKALDDQPSLELRRRVEGLLQKLDGPVTLPDHLRSLRAIEVLEHIGTPAAQQVLASLAKGAAAARLTREAQAAMARLERRGGAP